MQYKAPIWLPGGNLQTIWSAKIAKIEDGSTTRYKRVRWNTPDGDFIDLDWLEDVSGHTVMSKQACPLLVLFHGLEGTSRSHYAMAFASYAKKKGMQYVVPHFRGCSGEINTAPRAYHSGDYIEIDWILKKIKSEHTGPVYAVGVSLGGNALLRWVEEAGWTAKLIVESVAAISAPIDLQASGKAIGQGFNRLVYTKMFLNTMKPKAISKLRQYPGLFNVEQMMRAKTLFEFDNVFTAPLHGFKSTEDYWNRASAKPQLGQIRVPSLVINAKNDPFVPAYSLATTDEISNVVTLWNPESGGHVGFPAGIPPGHVRTVPEIVINWLLSH